MGRSCAVCVHEAQGEIEAAMVAGVSLRKLASRHGVSAMALSRHKRGHLSPAMAEVQRRRVREGAATLVDRLEVMAQRLETLIDGAESRGNIGQTVAATRELRATVELLARVTGELDSRPVIEVNVLADPAFTRACQVILDALEPFPEARSAAADGLRRLEAQEAA